MELYGAIDLHSTNNVTVLIDEQDEVVYQKRLSNDLALVLEQLSPYQLSIQGIVGGQKKRKRVSRRGQSRRGPACS